VAAITIFVMRVQIEHLFGHIGASTEVLVNHDVQFGRTPVQIETLKTTIQAMSAPYAGAAQNKGTALVSVAQSALTRGPTPNAKLLANTFAAILFGRPLPVRQIQGGRVSAGTVDLSELRNLDEDVDLALAKIRVEMALQGDGYLAVLEKARKFQIEVNDGQVDVLIEAQDGAELFDAIRNAMGSIPRLGLRSVRIKTSVLNGQNVIDGPYFQWRSKTDEGIVQTIDQGVLLSVRSFPAAETTGSGESLIFSSN
jgi:hypothetical protein